MGELAFCTSNDKHKVLFQSGCRLFADDVYSPHTLKEEMILLLKKYDIILSTCSLYFLVCGMKRNTTSCTL